MMFYGLVLWGPQVTMDMEGYVLDNRGARHYHRLERQGDDFSLGSGHAQGMNLGYREKKYFGDLE